MMLEFAKLANMWVGNGTRQGMRPRTWVELADCDAHDKRVYPRLVNRSPSFYTFTSLFDLFKK